MFKIHLAKLKESVESFKNLYSAIDEYISLPPFLKTT